MFEYNVNFYCKRKDVLSVSSVVFDEINKLKQCMKEIYKEGHGCTRYSTQAS